MPFPLAHPAAALPFRRLCPRYLSLPGMLIGSIVPDLAYVIDDLNRFSKTFLFLFGNSVRYHRYVREDWEWSTFTHTLMGGAVVCLPAGILLLYLFFRLRAPLAATLPQPHRDALLPLCGNRHESIAACLAALILGILMHLVWDTFTHANGWFSQNSEFLYVRVFSLAGHAVSRLQLFWLISSSGGMLVLLAAYIGFLRHKRLPLWVFARSEGRYYVFWAIVLSLPVLFALPITDHFVRTESSWDHPWFIFHVFSEYYLMILGLFLIGIGSFLRKKTSRKSD
jgi:hypothetical protein